MPQDERRTTRSAYGATEGIRGSEHQSRRPAGRRSAHLGARRAAPAHHRRSGARRPDLRADRLDPRGGRGHQGAGPGPARPPRRAGHRRRRGRRPARDERGPEGRSRRRGAQAARRRRAEEAGDRPDGRAEPGLAAPLPALDRARAAADGRPGGRPGQAHRARRHGGQDAHGRGQPAPGRVDRQGLPRARPDLPRPHPGGLARAHPRGREVRLPPRLQVLDLRDVVDPPGRDAGDRRQGPDDPHPGPHGREAQQGRPRRAAARPAARPRADAGGDRRPSRVRRCARCATSCA